MNVKHQTTGVCCCSVAQSCPTPCNPMDCSTPGFPILHHLLELAQTHVHWVSDAIQPTHPLSSPSPPAFTLSQHQGLSNGSGLHIRWPKCWSFSFSISPSMNIQDWFPLGWTGLILQCKGLSRVFSNITFQKHQFFGTQPSLGSNFHITWQLEKPQLWLYEPLLVNLAFYSTMNIGNKPQQCLSMTWLPVNIKHIFLSYYCYFSHYFKIAMVIESSNRYSILMY